MKKLTNFKSQWNMKTINHQLHNKSFYIPKWRVKHLFLGTFNPMGGQQVNYYYGRARNQTWKLLTRLFCKSLCPKHPEIFFYELKKNQIACMDMIDYLKAPTNYINGILGEGYSDKKIINAKVKREYNTKSILKIIKKNPGITVYSTWGKGSNLIEWQSEIAKISEISEIIPLVSPSMAARVPRGQKKFDYMLADWRNKIKPFANKK